MNKMPKRFILSILLLTILLFSLPKPAEAFVFDYFNAALGGIEEKAGPIAKYIVAFFFAYLIGLSALGISTTFLQTAMKPELISLQGSSLVEAGWHFTVGVANMFIIIILLYIAFSFILKIENIQMKKALPKLILVALLLNFSLLFVGMLVDIGNITINTFFKGNENLPSLIAENLGIKGMEGAKSLGSWILVLAGMFMVPFLAPFSQFALVSTFVTMGIFLPTLIAWLFHLICFFLISAIFLIYAFLFIARIFVIQLLAILAPLAFLALILPQTKKYWDKWLKVLIEWVFLGVVLLFFMTLGLKTVHQIAPESGTIPWPGFGFAELKGYFIYYIFLVIYLAVAFILSKKTMPTAAQAIIDQAKGLGQMAIGRGLIPLGGEAKKRLQEFASRQKIKEEEMAAAKARGEEVKISRLRGLAMGTGKYMRRGIEGVHTIAGTTVPAAMERNLSEKAAEYGKRYGTDFKGAAKDFSKLIRGSDQAAMALYLEKTKGGKALSKLSDEDYLKAAESVAKYRPKKLDDITKHRMELFDDEKAKGEEHKRIAKLVQNTLVSDGLNDSDIKKMASDGIKFDGKTVKDLAEGDEEDKAKLIRMAFMKKSVDALKNEDVDNLTDKTLDDTNFQEMTARYKNISFIRKIGEEKGSAYVDKIQDMAESIDPNLDKAENIKEIAKTNASLVRAPFTPGGRMIMRPWEGIPGETLGERSARANEIIAEAKKEVKEEAKKAPPPSLPELESKRNEIKGEIDKIRTEARDLHEQKIMPKESPLLSGLRGEKSEIENKMKRARAEVEALHTQYVQAGMKKPAGYDEKMQEYKKQSTDLEKESESIEKKIAEEAKKVPAPPAGYEEKMQGYKEQLTNLEKELKSTEEKIAEKAKKAPAAPPSPPSLSELKSKANEVKIEIEKLDNEARALKKTGAPDYKEREQEYKKQLTDLKEELKNVKKQIKGAKK